MKTPLTGISMLMDDEVAELYTIKLRNGTLLYFTTFDIDIPYQSANYLALALNVERGPIKMSMGLEVDDVDFTIYHGQDDTIQGVPYPQYAINGGFDGAWITIERARKNRVTHLFKGIVTDANGDVTQTKLTLSAPTVLLDIDMPKNKYSPGCINTLYDAACGLHRASHTYTGVITSGSTIRIIHCNLTQADGFFDLGKIQITTGDNAGSHRTVREYSEGIITLAYPLNHALTVGDEFSICIGCDKKLSTCKALGNELRYRGFDFMPKKEANI
jgi:uncharacterized phage protein (TIGR02218 family)